MEVLNGSGGDKDSMKDCGNRVAISGGCHTNVCDSGDGVDSDGGENSDGIRWC